MDVSFVLLSGGAGTRVTDIMWESALLRIRATEVFEALSFITPNSPFAVIGSGRTSACANGGWCLCLDLQVQIKICQKRISLQNEIYLRHLSIGGWMDMLWTVCCALKVYSHCKRRGGEGGRENVHCMLCCRTREG